MASGGSTISSGGGLTDRYAAALYSLADDHRDLDRTVEQVAALGRLIDQSPDLRRLLGSPLVDIHQSRAAMTDILASQGFGKLVQDFVGVIVNNRRLPALREIVAAFGSLASQKRGVVVAKVTTAHPLSAVQREQLRARLIEAGYGKVDIEEQVDPSQLGGLVVRIGARLFDSSIKSRLQRLQYAMKGAA